ncbi:hypothetical protein N9025_02205 [Synechococcus sp. AH-707-B22]|nr:hypothetical protein [Synechococcus sp. AH-707-B22]
MSFRDPLTVVGFVAGALTVTSPIEQFSGVNMAVPIAINTVFDDLLATWCVDKFEQNGIVTNTWLENYRFKSFRF